MGIMVEVLLDGPKGLVGPDQIYLEPDMSLNGFRRACGRFYGTDIISIFLKTGEKASDTAEIRRHRKVIASPFFYLKNPVDDQSEESRNSRSNSGSGASTTIHDIRRLTIALEILSHSGSGKTTFIQSFVHEAIKRERSQVVEAVYRKNVDLESTVAEFAITDTSESAGEEILRRIRDKQAVLLCLSKEKLIDQSNLKDLSLTQAWVFDKIRACKRESSDMYVGLVITKSDIMCEQEALIEACLSDLSKAIDVFKVSLNEDALGTDLRTPAQVFNTVGEKVLLRRASRKKESTISSVGMPTHRLQVPELPVEAPGWFSKFGNFFSCMSSR
jgi:hypothetical protein